MSVPEIPEWELIEEHDGYERAADTWHGVFEPEWDDAYFDYAVGDDADMTGYDDPNYDPTLEG